MAKSAKAPLRRKPVTIRSRAKMCDVTLAKSRLPGAGQGLFATRELSAGTQLPQHYKGNLLTEKEFLRKGKDCQYMMGLSHPKYHAIDAKPITKDNPLRYINAAKTASQRRLINCQFYQRGLKVFYATTRRVGAGAELVTDYGTNYWEAIRNNTRALSLQRRRAELLKRLRTTTKREEKVWLKETLDDLKEKWDELTEG
mmetsp:Transcript_14488/g.31792  ORF Transcript_14488/g.31792 Transcript_14488/m.31792 type:complete len:199 (-) Transcript_14488:24-620(-)